MDNFRLKKVKLSVRREEENRGKTILLTEEDFRENHSITSELTSYEGYQIIGYDAWDYAGNKISTRNNAGEMKVLINSSALFHFYNRYRTELAFCLLCMYVAILPGIVLTRKLLFGILSKKIFSGEGR